MNKSLMTALLLLPLAAAAHVGDDTGAHHGIAPVLAAGALALLVAALLHPASAAALRRVLLSRRER